VTEGTIDDVDIHRKSGAQPTLLGVMLGATGPDTQPGNVSTPHGHGPERLYWRVDLRDNTYKYERCRDPEGRAEHARGETQIRPLEPL